MMTIGKEWWKWSCQCMLFSVRYHLIVDKYWGYLYRTRWCRLNPRLRSHHLLYECKTVLFYGVPIVDFQIFRHADEHDQLTSLRCLCCKVNVAKITVPWFCVSMNIACFGWEEEKKQKKNTRSHLNGGFIPSYFFKNWAKKCFQLSYVGIIRSM